jgi:hypothetical protein
MHFGTKSYLKSNRYHTAKHLVIGSVQVNFNSLAHCSNTRALAHACCSAQPGHWLGPVTGSGWLSPAQPPKNKKLKKIESVEIEILHVLEKMYFNNLFIDIRIRNKKIS